MLRRYRLLDSEFRVASDVSSALGYSDAFMSAYGSPPAGPVRQHLTIGIRSSAAVASGSTPATVAIHRSKHPHWSFDGQIVRSSPRSVRWAGRGVTVSHESATDWKIEIEPGRQSSPIQPAATDDVGDDSWGRAAGRRNCSAGTAWRRRPFGRRTMSAAKFDGLADAYDRSRPRYPREFFELIARQVRLEPTVLDAGAGTGIALEGLMPVLDERARYCAIDISEDMVSTGKTKFPSVEWEVTPAEPYLENRSREFDLIVVAQAYQWMDRARFVRASRAALAPGGVLAIMQNNRNYQASAFLNDYESLLEKYSPGYVRTYRSIDVAHEVSVLSEPQAASTHIADWSTCVTANDFVTMSSSSTQSQRAVASDPGFLGRVHDLAQRHTGRHGLRIDYRSELFLAPVSSNAPESADIR